MHSVVRASRPLIMMLRHIFTADASPTRSEKTLTRISYRAASSAKAVALGPPSSMGERKPRGGTPVITAASTYRPPACPTIRAGFLLRGRRDRVHIDDERRLP